MIAITNGKIQTITNGVLERATVLIEKGKISRIDNNVQIPENYQIIDASHCWVTPGFIDAHTHIGNHSEPQTVSGQADHNEYGSPLIPQARVLDAFNPRDIGIKAAREAGFTTCCSLPGSGNIIGGTGLVFKTKEGKTVDDLVLYGHEMMKFALGENPIHHYGSRNQKPSSRMGVIHLLREMLTQAKLYSLKTKRKSSEDFFDEAYDFNLEALRSCLEGEMRCRFHCHRADDIYTAIRISEEYGLNYSLEHATEGYKIADVLAEKGAICVLGPLVGKMSKMEIWERDLTAPGILDRAGIRICLSEDGCTTTRYLPMHIGLCMANGLRESTAFEAVTINPAQLLGMDHRIGSLEVGKDADIAVFDGHPFSNFTHCTHTIIDGVVYNNSLYNLKTDADLFHNI